MHKRCWLSKQQWRCVVWLTTRYTADLGAKSMRTLHACNTFNDFAQVLTPSDLLQLASPHPRSTQGTPAHTQASPQLTL